MIDNAEYLFVSLSHILIPILQHIQPFQFSFPENLWWKTVTVFASVQTN